MLWKSGIVFCSASLDKAINANKFLFRIRDYLSDFIAVPVVTERSYLHNTFNPIPFPYSIRIQI